MYTIAKNDGCLLSAAKMMGVFFLLQVDTCPPGTERGAIYRQPVAGLPCFARSINRFVDLSE